MNNPQDVEITEICGGNGSLLCAKSKNNANPDGWYSENKDWVESNITLHGGILLRGFDIHSLSEFNRFSKTICSDLLDYTYRSTPRTRLGGQIYTATEYPPDQHISLHNENSYTSSWPSRINFFCLIAPNEGGETPIADSRRVLDRIDPEVVQKFKNNGIKYVRNYSENIDLSWQEVFQTSQREDVETFCNENGIDYTWKDGPIQLRTSQTCQSTISHPQTKEEVWFNQAHLFNVRNLGEEVSALLAEDLGKTNLPRNAYFGDGQEIDDSILDHISDCFEEETITFRWRRGDIMVLDNLLMAHGRNPFKGERKIAVSMG